MFRSVVSITVLCLFVIVSCFSAPLCPSLSNSLSIVRESSIDNTYSLIWKNESPMKTVDW